jgi:hypothetical protein
MKWSTFWVRLGDGIAGNVASGVGSRHPRELYGRHWGLREAGLWDRGLSYAIVRETSLARRRLCYLGQVRGASAEKVTVATSGDPSRKGTK